MGTPTIAQQNKEAVARLLKWTEAQYAEYQFEQGLDYLLTIVLGNDDTWLKELSGSHIFWQWWKNQWENRDANFLIYAEALYYSERLGAYKDLNSITNLKCRPHKVVMEETYSVMMQQFIDHLNPAPCHA